MAVLIALLLVVEGLSTGLWIARVVPMLGYFSAAALILAVLRGLTGATQLAGGVFLMGGRRSAVKLSQFALLASAILTTLEIGERITPNNLVPSLRWPLVMAYWAYAVGAGWYLGYFENREVRVEKRREVQGEKDREVREEKNPEVLVDKNAEVVDAQRVKEPESSSTESSGTDSRATGDPNESGERPRLFE